jgi:gliding motility-associated-like protein
MKLQLPYRLSAFFTHFIKPILIILLLLFCWQPGLFAQMVRFVKANGTGTGNTWANASGDLQATINASAAGDLVFVAKGNYQPAPAAPGQSFKMKDGVRIFGGFAGFEGSPAERDLKTNVSVLVGNEASVIVNTSISNTATLDGFTIGYGRAAYGAGMYNDGSSPIIRNCLFTNNIATGGGAGMYNNNASSPAISNCIFSWNNGGTDGGGGMFNNNNSSPVVTNCIFTANKTNALGSGTGMLNEFSSPTIINCLFSGNSALYGGGMYNHSSSPKITNCTFSGNVTDMSGGGIYSSGTSNVVITNSIISGNGGGELVKSAPGTYTVTYSLVKFGYPGTGNIDADPVFVAGDYSLQSISPAINAGDNAGYENADGNTGNNSIGNDKDLSGYPRSKLTSIDMGAYEFQRQLQTIGALATITKNYGDADFEPGATATSGLTVAYASADNNIAEAFKDAADGNKWKIKIKQAGTVKITASQPGDGTYGAAANMEFDVSINRKYILVTAAAKSKVYGGADPALTYIASTLVGGDTFSGSLSRTGGEDAGSYAINRGDLALSSNYNIIYLGNILTINPKTITVTADAKSKTYGDADPALTYTASSTLVGSDVFTGALNRAGGSDVGTYAISQGTLALNSNYSLTYVGNSFTISPKSITVTADTKSKTYGDADPALTYTAFSTLVGGDVFNGALSRAGASDVGTYAIGQGTLALNSNYSLTYVGSNFTINPKAITVTADAKNKIYGDADPALTYNASATLVGSDAFTGAISRTAGENAGTYAIGQVSLTLSSNYSLSYTGNSLVINKAPLTVTSTDKIICFNDAVGTIPVNYSGFKNSDNASSLNSVPRVNVPSFNAAGNYPLTPSGGSATNYNFNYVNGQLTVLPTPAGTIAQSPTAAGAVSGFQLAAPVGTQYQWSTGETTSAITVRSSDNYSVKVTNQQGCSNNFTAQVKLETLSVPNTFSPNGDGINDYWMVPELSNYPNAYVIVVNRDGQTVFETKAFTRWEGKYGGNTLPAGVYFYRIRKEPGATPVTGWLNILR